MMPNALATKLSSFCDLSPDDLERLDSLTVDARSVPASTILINEGDRPDDVFLLVEGWACRQKYSPDGKRQIMAYLVPGDLCDIHIFILEEMDHTMVTLSDARVAAIPKQTMLSLFDESPGLVRALWWSTLVDEAVLREWIVNIGVRDAYGRIAHLFAELWFRLNAVGWTQGNSFELPLTQVELGDTVGLTPVHVNRTLQRMRQEGLIELSSRRLRIPDVQKLVDATGFDTNYLHLSRRRASVHWGPTVGTRDGAR